MERRFYTGDGFELRMDGEKASRVIRGIAVPWDSLSVQLWTDHRTGLPVYERFKRGAFAGVLAGADIVCLRDHNVSRLLGRTKSGTLRVREGERGLEYDFDPPNTSDGNDLVELIKRGDVRGSSFAFGSRRKDEDWREVDGKLVRTILKVTLLEDVSPVTNPAYPGSSVSERSLETAKQSLEAWRDATGLDRVAAAARERELQLLELG